MIGRIATFSQTLHLLDSSLRTQSRLADVQSQTASGLKSTTFGGYGLSTAALARQQNAQSLAEAEADNAGRAVSVAEQAYEALGSISDLAETILSSLAADTLDAASLPSLAEGWLDDLQSLLNSRYGDKAIFAGAATAATAVDLDAWSAADPDAYYQGSSQALAYIGADGVAIDLSLPGDAEVLSDLITVLKNLSQGDATADEALDAVKQSASDIGEARARLSSNVSRLERIAESATARADSAAAAVSLLKEADLAEAAVLATQYQTQLETAYSTLNMLMSVKLSDYLR